MNNKTKCPECGKEYSKNGIGTHVWRMHTEQGKKFNPNKGYEIGTRKVWNKGLTKETDNRVKNSGEKLSNFNKGENNYMFGKHLNDETKRKISENRKAKFASGDLTISKGIGRGKHGWYKGYWCDSSYELAFVIYNLEHDILFIRNKEGFEYEYNNEKHNYYPDFIMEDGTYVEIKGYETEQTKAKQFQFPYKLQLICGKKGIKIYLQYVSNKYGNDFINLYEDKVVDMYELSCHVNYDYLKNKLIIEPLKNNILNSKIDFLKFGWVGKVASILDISSSKVSIWMKKYMLEFYETKCFKRKAC